MPNGASLRETKSSAARTSSALAIFFSTASHTPSFCNAALPYLPAGTESGLAMASLPSPIIVASGKPGMMSTVLVLSAGSTSTSTLPKKFARVSGLIALFFCTSFIQSRSAEMKMSAGAPLSICLARAELAA
jgi:hypothetical protein